MSEKSSKNELIYIFLLYLVPICGWIFYTHLKAPLLFSWYIALIGVILLCFGSVLLFLLSAKPSVKIKEPLIDETPAPQLIIERVLQPPEPPTEYIEKIDKLETEVNGIAIELENKETEISRLTIENKELKDKLQENLEIIALKEEEARKKIEGLESEVHQKMQTSKNLENQIHDLRYEIKTLLQLTEVDYPSPQKEEIFFEPPIAPAPSLICSFPSHESAKSLLTRCINIAQKMTAGYHVSSVRHLSSDPYAFDLRRLSDALRHEMGALIIVYSPKEERVLFSNTESKTLLGVSPEQFSQDFKEYIGEGFSIWKSAIPQLLTKSDVSVVINFETKTHEIVPLKVLLGAIPTGVFRSLIIGVLQFAQSQ